jgi:hypothetical protein
MILSSGPPDFVSFTDETSLDQRKTAGSKVSIHCQVLRECSLDWYYRQRRRAPNEPGELKSHVVTNIFLSLPHAERQEVLKSLRYVRVNITDPRPYIADFDGILGALSLV